MVKRLIFLYAKDQNHFQNKAHFQRHMVQAQSTETNHWQFSYIPSHEIQFCILHRKYINVLNKQPIYSCFQLLLGRWILKIFQTWRLEPAAVFKKSICFILTSLSIW